MTSSWFDTNQERLAELFGVLGVDAPVDDAEALAAWCEAEGWYGEHGKQPGRPVFTADQAAAAMPILREVGLDGQVDPPAEHFDEIIVMGAAGIGMHRRIQLVARSSVTADGLTVLAGLRPHEGTLHDPEVRRNDGTLSELIAVGGHFGAADGWSLPGRLAIQADLLRAADVDDFTAAAILFPTETDLAIFLLTKQYPQAVPTVTLHAEPHDVMNELGQRELALREWANPPDSAIPTLRVLNAPPVRRINHATGDPIAARPTAVSTFHDWLTTVVVRLPASHSRVLMVVNQPHLGRIRHQILTELAATDHAGMQVSVAGCATTGDVDVNLLLGEIPRWIRADRLS